MTTKQNKIKKLTPSQENAILRKQLEEAKNELHEGQKLQKGVSSQTIKTSPGKQEITTKFMKSFSPFAMISLLGTLLTYGHKLPIIGKIIRRISIIYARTTIWKLLVKLRKAFIVMNAIIGIYLLIHITGFNQDNIIGGISGIGYAYIDMITSFFKKLFTWIFDLFDTKIVPKPPADINNGWKWWGPKENTWAASPMNDPFKAMLDLSKSQEIYKTPYSSGSDWHIPNWLWYTGVALLSLGVLYVGCKLLLEYSPWFAPTIDKGKGPVLPGNTPDPGNAPDPGNIPNPENMGSPSSTTSNFINSIAWFGIKAYGIQRSVISALNPITYISSYMDNKENYENFVHSQLYPDNNNPTATPNRALYPYTHNNPYNSIFTKIRHFFLGESNSELEQRLQNKNASIINFNTKYNPPSETVTDLQASSSTGITGVDGLGLGFNPPVSENLVTEQSRLRGVYKKLGHQMFSKHH